MPILFLSRFLFDAIKAAFISHGLTAGRRPQFHLRACVWKRGRKKRGGRERDRVSEEVAAGGPLKNNGLGSVVAGSGVTLARAKL